MSENFTRQGYRVGLILLRNQRPLSAPVVKVLSRREPHLAAEPSFLLRCMDSLDVDVIVAEGLHEQEMGQAVMNRLRKCHKNYQGDLIVTQRSVVK